MPHDFWQQRWAAGQIGFHEARVSPDLQAHTSWFLPRAQHRVLVPLAGKSWDLPWLADQGHHVVGSELVEQAVRAMFDEHARPADREPHGDHVVWRAGNLEVWQGDFFALPEAAGGCDRVWDRAALVALEPQAREDYVRKVGALAPGALLLLNALDYDPGVMTGPPFSVPPAEVLRLYGASNVEELGCTDLIETAPRWRERGHRWFHSHVYRISLPKSA
jgi:thiopurine S-methyltransferase